jgi:hypothetical protein
VLVTHRPQPAGTATVTDSYAAAVYGSIVAAAIVGAVRDEHASSMEAALTLLSTMGVFWLAHVWSRITGERIHYGTRFAPSRTLEIARSEWPLVEAAIGPAAVLLLGWAGVFTDRTALTAALVICGVQLVTWGFIIGTRAYDRWYYAVLSGVVNGVFGFVLVALEAVVLH